MTVANNYQPIRQLGNGVTTAFSFNFRVLEDEQIVVYELPEGGEQQVVDSNEYTVNLTNSGGNVVFNTAPANGTVIVITRSTPQTQETPYKTSQGFPAAVVEGDFDKLTMMVQELQQDSDRSVKVDVTSGVTPDVLVNQVERIYESVDNIDTVADDISNVNTTAGSIANVNTTAGAIANVNTVAGIAADVATVAAISSDVSGVAGISTEVSGVYYSRGAVENVANNVNDVVNVSDNVLFVQTAANNISNINTVGNNISDVNTTAGSIANVNAVAGNASNINAVAGNASNINTVAGNASNINAVAGNASNINAVASDLTNIDAVAGDLTNIDNASSYAALAKQYAIGDPSEPTGNSAKYWAEQAATQAIPSQTGQSGKYLTTDGTDMNWASVAVLPSQTGHSGEFLTTDGTDASWAAVSTRNIGEIVQSTIPLTDAGLHLLDGSLLQGGGAYGDFVTYIAGLVSDYPDLFDTEANWQQSVTDYGVCGKFVYDSVNGTVRLPKITGFTEGAIDTTVLGDLVEAGLPNITGEIQIRSVTNASTVTGSGVFTLDTHSGTSTNSLATTSNVKNDVLTFNASLSNSIYGNSTTVQPQAIKVLYYIVIATSVKTEIEVDIDEIATDLNGKADVDLSNCTKPYIVETYTNGTSWYRVYSDGWVEQGGQDVASATGAITITLLKPFADSNYTVTSSIYSVGTPVALSNGQGVGNKTATTFQYYCHATSSGNGGYNLMWMACGYGASN